MEVILIGGANRSAPKKPPTTCRKYLQTLPHNVILSTPRHEREYIARNKQ